MLKFEYMSIFDASLLGLTQGLTEFLPVSSTGHLILIRDLFGISSGNTFAFDTILQLATLFAVIIYFYRDIWALCTTAYRMLVRKAVSDTEKTFLYALIIGTLPAVVLGFFFADTIEGVFHQTIVVAVGLCVGTLLMIYAEKKAHEGDVLTVRKGFLTGWFQALALIPGISRSGATISGGMIAGLSREQATRFSFILSFPVLLGAGLLSIHSLLGTPQVAGDVTALIVGCAVSFFSGLAAIHFLITYIKTHSFSVFIWYRIMLALVIVALVAMDVLA